MSQQPAVIDISGLESGEPAILDRVARDLEGPCAEWGVFHVVGHALPAERLCRFEQAMRDFFELPADEKSAVRRTRDNARGYYDEELTKNRPDWKEVFDYGAELTHADAASDHSDGVNQWPQATAGAMRDALLDHYTDCEQIARLLVRALCCSLGLPPNRLDGAFGSYASFVRLNRYVPCPDPAPPDAPFFPEHGHLGVHHHTDAGALTVLYQDEVAGLQAMRGEHFVSVEPVPGAFTINLADMLQVWSNDRYRSPLHRVIANNERARHSAPFFLNPTYETICAPLPELVTPASPARYRPISWARFRDQRSAGDYADYGNEIQIEDFRIG